MKLKREKKMRKYNEHKGMGTTILVVITTFASIINILSHTLPRGA